MKLDIIISNITFEGNMNSKGEKFFIFSFDKKKAEGTTEDIEYLLNNTPWSPNLKSPTHIFVKADSNLLLENGMSLTLEFDKKSLSKDTKNGNYNISKPKININQYIGYNGFVRYLNTIDGIGKVSAEKIASKLEEEFDFKLVPMVEKFTELIKEESDLLKPILKKKISKVQTYLDDKYSSFEDEKNSNSLTKHEEVFGIKYGISNKVLIRIKKILLYKLKNNSKLQMDTTDVSAFLKYKPYYLAADTEFSRLGFKTIDKISWNIRKDDNNFGNNSFDTEDFKKQRFFGFLHCAITEGYNNDGHMFMKLTELRERIIKQNKDREVKGNPELIIDIFDSQTEFNMYVFDILDGLREEGVDDFILFENAEDLGLTTIGIHKNELNLTKKLLQINSNTPFIDRIGKSKDEIEKIVRDIEKSENISLSDEQRTAVLNTLHAPISIITGGPGTGKTTTSNVVIKTLEYFNAKIKILAPTGTAANRVAAVSGMDTSTIHRGLGSKGAGTWKYNENNPLEDDIIIVDESSMIDVQLANKLLSASMNSNIIFLGDVNQLPSVGPGRYLGDLIDSGVFNVSILTKVFRQAAGNPIIQFAYAINNGDSKLPYKFMTANFEDTRESKLSIVIKPEYKQPDKDSEVNDGLTDFEREELKALGEYEGFEEIKYLDNITNDAIDMAETIHHLENSIYDVQVLTNSNIVSGRINQALQNKLNPGGLSIPNSKGINQSSSTTIRVGDKIMHIKNNYKLEIFNGSIGRVSTYDHKTKEVEVVFTDGQTINYPIDVFAKEVRLNYSMTIHKSQGQEFKNLIQVSLWNPLSREILYTGVTRAKEKLIMFTNEKILRTGIFLSGADKLKRNTRLLEFLKDKNFIHNLENFKYFFESGDYHILSPFISSHSGNDKETVSIKRKEIEEEYKKEQEDKKRKEDKKNVVEEFDDYLDF